MDEKEKRHTVALCCAVTMKPACTLVNSGVQAAFYRTVKALLNTLLERCDSCEDENGGVTRAITT